MSQNAAAHDCTAEDPATSCGECTAGDHDHEYNDGSTYCRSSCDSPCLPIDTDAVSIRSDLLIAESDVTGMEEIDFVDRLFDDDAVLIQV